MKRLAMFAILLLCANFMACGDDDALVFDGGDSDLSESETDDDTLADTATLTGEEDRYASIMIDRENLTAWVVTGNNSDAAVLATCFSESSSDPYALDGNRGLMSFASDALLSTVAHTGADDGEAPRLGSPDKETTLLVFHEESMGSQFRLALFIPETGTDTTDSGLIVAKLDLHLDCDADELHLYDAQVTRESSQGE